MSSKLVPSDPAKVMVIRDVVPRVITTLSVPFWRFGRIKVGGRGTIGKSSQPTLCTSADTYHSTPPIRRPRRLLPRRLDRRSQAKGLGARRSEIHRRSRPRSTPPSLSSSSMRPLTPTSTTSSSAPGTKPTPPHKSLAPRRCPKSAPSRTTSPSPSPSSSPPKSP